jgi:polyferredoxin
MVGRLIGLASALGYLQVTRLASFGNKSLCILCGLCVSVVETVVGLFVVRGDAREITGAVKSGNHVLQVEVITWRKSNKMAKGLRARWRRYGTVWYEPITSVAVPFTVEKERKIADCP